MISGSWPRTTFFNLRVPKPRAQAFSSQLIEALGNQVEILGQNLRVLASPGQEVAVGDGVTLTGPGSAEAGSAATNGVAVSGGFGEQVFELVAIVPPESAPATSQGTSVSVLSESEEETVSSVTGFPIDSGASLFDGTSPVLIHRVVALGEAFVDDASAPTSSRSNGFDNSSKVDRFQLTVVGSGETITAWFPIWIPSDLVSLFSGDAAPVFAVRAKGGGGATVTLAFVDSSGTTHADIARSADSSVYFDIDMLHSVVAAATATPGTLCWLKVTLAAPVGITVSIERSARFRYQQRRAY